MSTAELVALATSPLFEGRRASKAFKGPVQRMSREVARRVDRAGDHEARLAAVSALLVYEEHAQRLDETAYIGRYMDAVLEFAGDLVFTEEPGKPPSPSTPVPRPIAPPVRTEPEPLTWEGCAELVRRFIREARRRYPATAALEDRKLVWLLVAATKPVEASAGDYQFALNAAVTDLTLQLIDHDSVISADDLPLLAPAVGFAVAYAISEGLTTDLLRVATVQMADDLVRQANPR